jgi:hypothetical protein
LGVFLEAKCSGRRFGSGRKNHAAPAVLTARRDLDAKRLETAPSRVAEYSRRHHDNPP